MDKPEITKVFIISLCVLRIDVLNVYSFYYVMKEGINIMKLMISQPMRGKTNEQIREERAEKYKKENCSRCKNRKEFECDIRVFQSKDAICTKCINYERED